MVPTGEMPRHISLSLDRYLVGQIKVIYTYLSLSMHLFPCLSYLFARVVVLVLNEFAMCVCSPESACLWLEFIPFSKRKADVSIRCV